MLTFRENLFPFKRQTKNFKISLGNSTPRYNSEVFSQRKKFYINSTRNSEDVPQWMSRTQHHYFKNNKQNSKSMYSNPQSSFIQTKQKWIYQDITKKNNHQGQFQCVQKKRIRTKYQMKNQTFEFQWPTNESDLPKKVANFQKINTGKRINAFLRFQMPKYGIKQSPLHRQKQTPIKIGHSFMLNSTYVA